MNTVSFACLLAFVAATLPASAQTAAAGAGQAAATPATTETRNAASSSPTTGASTSATSSPDYRLGAGDKIRIEVYKEPQLSQSLQIRPDGKITMPLIGDLVASGLTPVQLRDQLTTSFKDYVNNPVVTVMVVEALASSVYIMGEVNKPGTIALAGPTTVLQALAMAGGLGQWAKAGKIRILRNGDHGVETIKFDYDAAIKGEGPLLYLQRGDTIIVP